MGAKPRSFTSPCNSSWRVKPGYMNATPTSVPARNGTSASRISRKSRYAPGNCRRNTSSGLSFFFLNLLAPVGEKVSTDVPAQRIDLSPEIIEAPRALGVRKVDRAFDIHLSHGHEHARA